MVSSERIPNESYAQRARKASTSSVPRTTPQKPSNATLSTTTLSSSSLKPPQVNVWAERISQQKVSAAPQSTQMPRQRAISSPQPPSDNPIQPRSPPPDLSSHLAILDRQDEHDPFVVRVPPHLSRQSSSGTNPLPVAEPTMWPNVSSADSAQPASTTNNSPLVSAPPSRQNSAASFPHHAHAHSHSPSAGSIHLSRVHSSFSQHSRSTSQSRVHSRSGSSASSPRLQFRPRALPQDDSIPPDPRSDHLLRRSSNKRSSPQLLDPSFPIDSVPPPADPSYYPRPPVPPLPDMLPCFPPNFGRHYALPLQFPSAHVPGHASPPYIPHSGQGTPPYSHYPPYPAYMYPHPSLFWNGVPPHTHFQSINSASTPPNPFNVTEHPALHKMEFGSVSPATTTEPSASKDSAQAQDTSQPRTSKGVIFGTTNLPESQDDPPTNERKPADAAVEHATEQFATFSIGVTADQPGPSRFASRKSSVRSLPKLVTPQLPTNDVAKGAHNVPPQGVNGIKRPVKWEFGTALSEDAGDSLPPSPPSQTSQPPSMEQSESSAEVGVDQPEQIDITPSEDLTRSNYSMTKSDTESSTSDVWVVKDYGYGFGNHSGSGNAPNVAHREMHERERQRIRDNYREREMTRDQLRDRGWIPPRQHGWRLENGTDDGRESWEQVQNDALRPGRPRRGSLPSYGHDQGGFPIRRGRGFGGRYHAGRARGGFFHHQRFGSYPHVAPQPQPPPPPPPPPPFELPPGIDLVNGYGQYVPPDVDPYEVVTSRSAIPFTPTTYSVDAMRNWLLLQLEYYLSPQNMAQDLYLRQRMDDEGWIPIPLLASFKRVRQLHSDSAVVKEVLSQSRSVEVSGEWVRMGGRQWKAFVLPNAPKSTVKGVDHTQGNSHESDPYNHDGDAHEMFDEVEGEHGETEGDYDGEDCEADEEEDDIEFVIGEEAEGRWMPVPERKS